MSIGEATREGQALTANDSDDEEELLSLALLLNVLVVVQ